MAAVGGGEVTSAVVVDLAGEPGRTAALRTALETSPLDVLSRAAPGLWRLLRNLERQTVDERHRTLRLGNLALRQRILDWWQPPAWPCPACTLCNAPGAAECAVCGGARPSWAEPPTLPPPRLEADAGPSAGGPGGHHLPSVAGARRPRGEDLRERDRILAEARADRQRFEPAPAAGGAAPAASSSSAVPQAVPSSSAPGPAVQRAALRVRLADGCAVEEVFASSEPLLRVFEWVDQLLLARAERTEDYALLQAIPRRVFIREVLGPRTLAELSLVPSAALSILRAEDRGRVQSGGVETALLTGDIEGLSYGEMLELESRMGDGKRARRPAPRELARARDQRTTVHVYRGAGAGPEVSAPSTAPAAAEERRCAICLEEFEPGATLRSLWCAHAFHKSCVDRWLADRDECPVCRVPLDAAG